jgi:Putative auto-transporter adhesin, head GIN domain
LFDLHRWIVNQAVECDFWEVTVFRLFTLFAALGLAACSITETTPASGVVVTDTRAVAGFSQLEIAGGFDVTWQAGAPSLVITADKAYLPLIKSRVTGDRLVISADGLNAARNISVTVSSEQLSGLSFQGAISFAAKGIDSKEFEVSSQGASTVQLAGKVGGLKVKLEGANHLQAKDLLADVVSVNMAGANDGQVTAKQSLSASLHGASSLDYFGKPSAVSNKTEGASSVNAL